MVARIVRLALLAGLLLSAPTLAESRSVVHRANGYTVYGERPGYCTLYLDTPRGAMIRIADDANAGQVFFSYVRAGFPQVPADQTIPLLFEFENDPAALAVTAMGYSAPDGRRGFSLVEPELQERWGHARSVTIRLGDSNRTPIETVQLNGSSRAVAEQVNCAHTPASLLALTPLEQAELAGNARPPEKPDPADTPFGRFSVSCRSGRGSYLLGTQTVATFAHCDPELPLVLAGSRTFPSGETILLLIGSGGGTANNGTIVRLKKGERVRFVDIDYMMEFGAIQAPNRVKIVTGGIQDINRGTEYHTSTATIDWQRQRIVE